MNNLSKINFAKAFKDKSKLFKEPLIRLEPKIVEIPLTIGDLKKLIAELPDEMYVATGSEGGDYIIQYNPELPELFITNHLDNDFDEDYEEKDGITNYFYLT